MKKELPDILSVNLIEIMDSSIVAFDNYPYYIINVIIQLLFKYLYLFLNLFGTLK
jgi:hypothetical protein